MNICEKMGRVSVT